MAKPKWLKEFDLLQVPIPAGTQVLIDDAIKAGNTHPAEAVPIVHEDMPKPPALRTQTPFEVVLSQEQAEELYRALSMVGHTAVVAGGRGKTTRDFQATNGVVLCRGGMRGHVNGMVNPKNDQAMHADVGDELAECVGGVSVGFVTGAQSSWLWCYSTRTPLVTKRLVLLYPHTLTILRGDQYHAGSTFREDNTILHVYFAHDFRQLKAYAAGKGQTFREVFDVVMFHPQLLTSTPERRPKPNEGASAAGVATEAVAAIRKPRRKRKASDASSSIESVAIRKTIDVAGHERRSILLQAVDLLEEGQKRRDPGTKTVPRGYGREAVQKK